MNTRDDRPERLVRIGTILKDAALSRLRQAAQECRRIEEAIAELDDEAQRAAIDNDIAMRAVFDRSRTLRHRERRTALNAELARARAQEALLMREAARAFGREEAIRGLFDRKHR
ncbi:hypothetical protein [Rhodovulum sulfidophilum]|uniref:Uncharacterized protein n=1 Tax=Rhodovulum sulfidophilum TaxID=35806 RepID=A0ABS1RXY0_RHOSU|nr:hypothetical protein [Rhodovulum sulfidophilum]MBL3610478.1 hypothetical protein [Rhodovulum sulfidophilum]MCE8455378.1 hypothetical protein [Rhodovulum sulfidophilum]